MSMNATPSGERLHIGIFGKRNAGKSSLINAITGQSLAVVSEVPGTTTDPVSKAMELLPIGPIVLIDTPGIDDEGELGKERVKKSYQVLRRVDGAILVINGRNFSAEDKRLLHAIQEQNIPYMLVYNKCEDTILESENLSGNEIAVSAKTGMHINLLRERMGKIFYKTDAKQRMIADLIQPKDFVVLVVPIDEAAPKGRLILPQQQTIRDVLEAGAVAITTKETELAATLSSLGKAPAVVVTDSQAFEIVNQIVPQEIPLTSFSILMARYKGVLLQAAQSVMAVDTLQEKDRVLIAEGCTHHRQCNDIGTCKLPKWIEGYTGKKLQFEFCSGSEFPENVQQYQLIVHCGGCMLQEREVQRRLSVAQRQNVPMTNYGMLIAYIHGILKRSATLFPDLIKI